MERRKQIEFKNIPKHHESNDVSEDGWKAVSTGKKIEDGLVGVTPELIGLTAMENTIKRADANMSTETHHQVVEDRMQEFGASETQIAQIFEAIEKLRDSDEDVIEGDGFIVSKSEKGGFDIKVTKHIEDSSEEDITVEEHNEDVVTKKDIADFLHSDNAANEDMGTEEGRAETLEEIEDYKMERRDTGIEDNPASKASHTSSQAQSNITKLAA